MKNLRNFKELQAFRLAFSLIRRQRQLQPAQVIHPGFWGLPLPTNACRDRRRD
jgi:hypothetical protein